MAHGKRSRGKATQRRGPSVLQRSKSGGAVKGTIPHPGGSNKRNFETGVNVTHFGVNPRAPVKPAPKAARRGHKK